MKEARTVPSGRNEDEKENVVVIDKSKLKRYIIIAVLGIVLIVEQAFVFVQTVRFFNFEQNTRVLWGPLFFDLEDRMPDIEKRYLAKNPTTTTVVPPTTTTVPPK